MGRGRIGGEPALPTCSLLRAAGRFYSLINNMEKVVTILSYDFSCFHGIQELCKEYFLLPVRLESPAGMSHFAQQLNIESSLAGETNFNRSALGF